MEARELIVALRDLYNVCNQFAVRAEPGNDIRQHGLTPELLARCRAVLEHAIAQDTERREWGENRSEMLPTELQEDGWKLYLMPDQKWCAYHALYHKQTGEYPMPEEAITEASVMARPY